MNFLLKYAKDTVVILFILAFGFISGYYSHYKAFKPSGNYNMSLGLVAITPDKTKIYRGYDTLTGKYVYLSERGYGATSTASTSE